MLSVAKWNIDLPPSIMWGMRKDAKLPKVLGRKIQRKRKESELTQEELAERASSSRAYTGYI